MKIELCKDIEWKKEEQREILNKIVELLRSSSLTCTEAFHVLDGVRESIKNICYRTNELFSINDILSRIEERQKTQN